MCFLILVILAPHMLALIFMPLSILLGTFLFDEATYQDSSSVGSTTRSLATISDVDHTLLSNVTDDVHRNLGQDLTSVLMSLTHDLEVEETIAAGDLRTLTTLCWPQTSVWAYALPVRGLLLLRQPSMGPRQSKSLQDLGGCQSIEVHREKLQMIHKTKLLLQKYQERLKSWADLDHFLQKRLLCGSLELSNEEHCNYSTFDDKLMRYIQSWNVFENIWRVIKLQRQRNGTTLDGQLVEKSRRES